MGHSSDSNFQELHFTFESLKEIILVGLILELSILISECFQVGEIELVSVQKHSPVLSVLCDLILQGCRCPRFELRGYFLHQVQWDCIGMEVGDNHMIVLIVWKTN